MTETELTATELRRIVPWDDIWTAARLNGLNREDGDILAVEMVSDLLCMAMLRRMSSPGLVEIMWLNGAQMWDVEWTEQFDRPSHLNDREPKVVNLARAVAAAYREVFDE